MKMYGEIVHAFSVWMRKKSSPTALVLKRIWVNWTSPKKNEWNIFIFSFFKNGIATKFSRQWPQFIPGSLFLLYRFWDMGPVFVFIWNRLFYRRPFRKKYGEEKLTNVETIVKKTNHREIFCMGIFYGKTGGCSTKCNELHLCIIDFRYNMSPTTSDTSKSGHGY